MSLPPSGRRPTRGATGEGMSPRKSPGAPIVQASRTRPVRIYTVPAVDRILLSLLPGERTLPHSLSTAATLTRWAYSKQ